MAFDRAALLVVTAGVAAALGQTVPWKTIAPERAGQDAAKVDAWRDQLAALRTRDAWLPATFKMDRRRRAALTLIFSGIKPNDAFCTRGMRLERR